MKGRTLRIAYGRIQQESNALSPVLTTVADFERTHLYEGRELERRCARGVWEVENFMKNAELSGFVQRVGKLCAAPGGPAVELVPTLSALTVPSGPLTEACFDELADRLCELLRDAGRLDGVYLSLHGAMNVENREECESEIVRRVRAVVGDIPVVATLDLHANVTRDLVEQCTALISYRTNPHRDQAATGGRAADLLVDTLLGKVEPVMAWRSLPMLVGGSPNLEFWPPLRSIWQRMRALEKNEPGVLFCSVNTCHPWNSHPELGWSTVVVTDGKAALADKVADELADRCWRIKDQLPPVFRDPRPVLAKARESRLARKTGVVVVSDASDVVSAGATGENTRLIKAFLEDGKGMLCYAGIRDPEVVAELWDRPVGEEVTGIVLGGKLDPARNEPLTVDARIVNKVRNKGSDRTVVLAVGQVRIVVVEGPCLIIQPRFYKMAGLSLWKADVVMVKNFFPFLLFFAPYMRKVFFVRTGGITDFDAAHALSFAGPMHPKEEVSDWRGADRRRRTPPPAGPKRMAA